MAQHNRRRSRGGGGANSRKNGQNGGPSNESNPLFPEPQFPELESGEEQLTQAQMAFGRPEPAEIPDEAELTAFEENASAREQMPAPSAGALSTGARSRRRGSDGESDALVEPTHKVGLLGQLVGFVQGSRRELQRVQWPDRRQVFQATGVVLGFVIVAGAFLGVASFAAQRIVNLILYGHG